MGREIDLLARYPRTARNVEARGQEKSEEDRRLARAFGEAFFDGDRRHGYGGFHYHPRFWQPVIPDFQAHFGLTAESSVLDVGCAKGFMLHDLRQAIPGIRVAGIDISDYAIAHAEEAVRPYLRVGDARELPFEDKSFDVVISITTLHNLERADCIRALREVERVSRKGSFITVDAYSDEAERKRMEAWNLTALTVLHVDAWRDLFAEAGYTGDYFWFMP
jgi:SAM-dependent methyltransferase